MTPVFYQFSRCPPARIQPHPRPHAAYQGPPPAGGRSSTLPCKGNIMFGVTGAGCGLRTGHPTMAGMRLAWGARPWPPVPCQPRRAAPTRPPRGQRAQGWSPTAYGAAQLSAWGPGDARIRRRPYACPPPYPLPRAAHLAHTIAAGFIPACQGQGSNKVIMGARLESAEGQVSAFGHPYFIVQQFFYQGISLPRRG